MFQIILAVGGFIVGDFLDKKLKSQNNSTETKISDDNNGGDNANNETNIDDGNIGDDNSVNS